jgi:osmotically-inducible protein OsmY
VAERGADEIQREIEQARVKLAGAVDQLAYQASPKRVVENVKASLKQRAQSPQGRAVIGVAGGLVFVLIVRRIRRGRH